MGLRQLGMLPLTALAVACGSPGAPGGPEVDGRRVGDPAGSGVVVSLSRSSYDWEAVRQGAGPEGTVTNHTGEVIYLRAGDGFATETQEQIFIAGGSDAGIERQVSGTWEPVAIDLLLVEGVGLVRMPAGATYPLRGGFGSSRSTGTHRIRIEYYSGRDRSPGTKNVAVSAPFTVD